MYKLVKKVGLAVGLVVTVLGLAFLFSLIISFPVMLLWNWLMPIIFGLAKLTLLQAWGLSLLCSMLFKTANLNKK
jgi:hypothetical protein